MIWWDNDELPSLVTKRIQRADRVYISAVSAWEIAVKQTLGKIKVKARVRDIISDYGFTELPITIHHTEQVGALPTLHRDPFDRLLVAQALCEDLVLVTADKSIARYPVPIAWE